MASKKTTSKRKSSPNSTKRKNYSNKNRKPKVYVSPYKALVLCFAVILFCLCLLLIVSKVDKTTTNSSKLPSISERFEEPKVTVKTEKVDKVEPVKVEPVKETETKVQEVKIDKVENKTEKTEKVVRKEEPVIKQTTSPATQEKTAETTKKQETKTTTPQTTTTQTVKASYNFPQAVNHAQLIFVFDDGGQNLNHLDAFLNLPFPITVAVLPRLAYSKESAKKIRASGNELMLHQPMQAINKSVNPGPGAITPEMDEDQIIATLFTNINEIGPVAGINNHEGSAITADAEKMEIVLKVASENGIFFLDSRTNVETKVPYVAGEMGYTYYERNIFLDNTKTKENALAELKKGLTIANKNGSVIMIGHVWSADFLPAFLKEIYPELKEKGYTFSVVSKSNAQKS
ncbi:MAG: divergent polysaccharide deacetylase family protein [Spirochaetia bacterium]|nr:divergent polysaccharide deacetylase family protein [Spirochaetia bacterium]